jgi:RNA polymerase sigma-70 factor (ECF subfamily)
MRGTGTFTLDRPIAASDLSADRAVVDRVLSGDREAFREIVDREGPALVRACHRVLGDLHEAEDAAQEAFVMAYRSLGQWRQEGALGAWLARIAVRIALRRAQRRPVVTWLDPANPGSADVAGALDPASVAVRMERAAEVREALADLDEPYREVVALRFFGDLSLYEIAEQTGRPLGTVKTHLHRGLSRLKLALDGVAP